MNKLSIVVSSTRPGRIGPKVAQWVADQAPSSDWEVELLDLAAIDLPFFNEEDMPKNGNYVLPHTKQWASAVFESDAIVVVTPQYNRSFPAPIKNAIDYLFAEWDSKPIALVGYGWTGAVDATSDLDKVLTHVKARVVGSAGLVFTRDITPEGEITATDETQGRLTELLSALATTVDTPVEVAS